MKKSFIRLLCFIAAIAMLVPLAASFSSCDEGAPEITEIETEVLGTEPEQTESVAATSDIMVADLSKYSLIRPEKASDKHSSQHSQENQYTRQNPLHHKNTSFAENPQLHTILSNLQRRTRFA